MTNPETGTTEILLWRSATASNKAFRSWILPKESLEDSCYIPNLSAEKVQDLVKEYETLNSGKSRWGLAVWQKKNDRDLIINQAGQISVEFKNCSAELLPQPELGLALTSGIQDGLRCLAGKTRGDLGADRKTDFARLLSFFEHPPKPPSVVECYNADSSYEGQDTKRRNSMLKSLGSSVARAAPPSGENPPRIEVNEVNLYAQGARADRSRVLFHETLHWLGYKHSEGVDATYLIEQCCFAKSDAACSLLRDSDSSRVPRMGWTSTEYLKRYTEIMLKEGKPMVAMQTAFAGLLSADAPVDGSKKLVAEGLYATALAATGRDTPDRRFVGAGEYLMMVAGAGTRTADTVRADFKNAAGHDLSSAQRKFAEKWGQALALLLKGDPAPFTAALRDPATRYDGCDAFNQGGGSYEKDILNRTMSAQLATAKGTLAKEDRKITIGELCPISPKK
ncbi:MAG: hypothetical protein HY074_00495 [Deltaproteobacteria bacterium]|nr:hypothetical protein [Deltaproteobacteria bacterium]